MARRSAIGAAVLALAIGCTACTAGSAGGHPSGPASAGDAGPGVITVGSFDFPESVLLAELYAGALSARGYPVRVLPDLGSRELVEPALPAGPDLDDTRAAETVVRWLVDAAVVGPAAFADA